MSFDAGEIVAKLRLDRTEFIIELDRAKADADERFGKPIDVQIKPELDERAVEEVLAEEEPLRADIEPEVKPKYAQAEAEQVGRTLASDILRGAESGGGGTGGGGGGGIGNLIGAMFGQGLNETEVASGLRNLGFSGTEIRDALGASLNTAMRDASSGGGQEIAAGIKASVIDASKYLERDGGKVAVRGLFDQLLGAAGGAGAPFDALSGGGGALASLFLNPLGLATLVAGGGGLGAALGGGLAGTAIGGAGTLVALLPGFLDLMKGYSAYQAQSTGASTSGMSPGALSLGSQIGGLLGAGGKGMGAAEKQIMPDITKFITALTNAIPLMDRFAQPAIRAMSGFFGVIDKGLGSGGFKSFMGQMDKLVGPIMTEFGKVIINMGTAFGGFLKLFGGVGAREIGPWFVKITGELSKFLNHVKLGHGFVAGMVTVFSNLGKILHAAWDALKLFGIALAPIGLQVFRIVGWLAEWADRVIKIIPPDLITMILGVVIGLKAFSVAMGVLTAIVDADPLVLIAGAVVALGVGIYLLVKHWRTVWTFIKKITDDVVHFIVGLFHNDLFLALSGPIGLLVILGEHWRTVWNGIQDVVKTVWGVIKPVFDAIKTAIEDIVGGVGKVIGIANKIGGGLIGGVAKGIGAVGSFFGGFLASGGPAQAGTPYVVGEQGPELFVPHTAGTVVPHGKFGGSQITFNIDARGHSNPSQIVTSVRNGIGATLPSLQAALARGAA